MPKLKQTSFCQKLTCSSMSMNQAYCNLSWVSHGDCKGLLVYKHGEADQLRHTCQPSMMVKTSCSACPELPRVSSCARCHELFDIFNFCSEQNDVTCRYMPPRSQTKANTVKCIVVCKQDLRLAINAFKTYAISAFKINVISA